MLRAYLLVYPYLAVYVLLGALIGVPWTWVTRDIRFLYWIARMGVRSGLWLSGVRVTQVRPELARKYPTCVFVCNHISNLDPPALFGVLPRIAFILKKELSRIPVLGYVMSLGSFIYVDRRETDSRRKALSRAVETLKKGVSLMVFPEGTRSKTGEMLPFRPGPFTMAIESGAAVVPITVHGTRELMPKGTLKIRPGRMVLAFHEPVDTTGMTSADRGAVMELVRARMQAALDGPDPLG